MQTVNVSFFRPTWIMIYFSARSPTQGAINPAWQCLTSVTVYNVHESGAGFCFRAFFFPKELLMNTLQFFTPQNYHIAIIHLHVVFKCIESSEELGGTVQMCSTTIPKKKKGGGGVKMLQAVWINGNILCCTVDVSDSQIPLESSQVEKGGCKFNEFGAQICGVRSMCRFISCNLPFNSVHTRHPIQKNNAKQTF